MNEPSETPPPSRERRERELTGILGSYLGRVQLTKLLSEYMKLPVGETPRPGTPIVQTILNHEFAGHRQEGRTTSPPKPFDR